MEVLANTNVYNRIELEVVLDTEALLGTRTPTIELLDLLDRATEIMVSTYQLGDPLSDWYRIEQVIKTAFSSYLSMDQGMINPLVNMLKALLNYLYVAMLRIPNASLERERDYVLDSLLVKSINKNSITLVFVLMPLF